jgi:hypothetical protein
MATFLGPVQKSFFAAINRVNFFIPAVNFSIKSCKLDKIRGPVNSIIPDIKKDI